MEKIKIGMKKVICFIMMVILIGANSSYVIATSKSELNSQSQDLTDKINDAKEELGDVKDEKSETLKQVEELTYTMSEYESQIADLDKQLTDLNTSLKEAEEKLAKATEDYDKQEELLEQRLVAQYEAGDTSYLDVLVASEDLSDFISNYYLVSELASYDLELLERIDNQKKEIEAAKNEIQTNKDKVDSVKKTKESKAKELQVTKNEKDKQVAKLNEQEKSIQAQLEQFEQDKRDIQNELAAIAKKEAEEAAKKGAGSYNTTPSKSGYIFPVAGCSKADIANKTYPSYRGHTGVDVNKNVTGKTVVAVKDGTVVTSKALKNADGSYRSYGEYIVINHHDGTMTLYAHGLAGSRRVSEGQSVKQGQAIMTVGSTGRSSGTHLHFEVRVGGSPVNPLPYLP